MTDTQAIADRSEQADVRFRFSLRTMLLAIAAAVAVVWLLASHGFVIGVVFSLFIYVIVRSISLDRRWVAISVTILCLTCWFGLQFLGPYTSLKNRVWWKIGVERLQTWTVSTLDSHQPIERWEAIEIPEDIREVLPNGYLSSDSSGVPKYVMFPVSVSRRGDYGVIVGRPGFVPFPGKHLPERLGDGVWIYRSDNVYF